MKLKKMLRILAAAMVVAALCCAPRLRRRGCGLRGGEYLDRRRDPD